MIEFGNITKRVMKSSALAFAMTTSIAFSGCSDSTPAPEPDAPAGKEMRICFSVKELPRTRVTHSGYSSTFDNGDEIGCIILYRDQNSSEQNFINSVWKYQNGVLILDSFLTQHTEEITENWGSYFQDVFGRQSQEDFESNEIISRIDDDGYLNLYESKEYEFYFYYPFIDRESLMSKLEAEAKAYNTLKQSGIDNPFNDFSSIPSLELTSDLSYTKWGTSFTLNPDDENSKVEYLLNTCLIGRTNKIYDSYPTDKLAAYSWQEYPAFVNTTQWTKDQFNMSDYLCASHTLNRNGKPITQETETREVSVEFKRINAVIEVQCEDEIPMGSIYFTSSSGLYRGTCLNLKNGSSSLYEPSQDYYATIQQKGCLVSDIQLRPMPMDEDYTGINSTELGSYNNFRIILPAQSFEDLALHFTLEGEEKTISLQNQLSEIQANHLYTIEIDKAGTSVLKINDWQTGKYTVIEYTETITEDTETSD